MLGKCYVEGTGVSKDVYKGTRLIEKSASQNFGPAQAYMAKCYYVGLGVPKDINKAEEYIVLAIKQGYTREEILKSINNIDIEL
jgi:TPR repeat protein